MNAELIDQEEAEEDLSDRSEEVALDRIWERVYQLEEYLDLLRNSGSRRNLLLQDISIEEESFSLIEHEFNKNRMITGLGFETSRSNADALVHLVADILRKSTILENVRIQCSIRSKAFERLCDSLRGSKELKLLTLIGTSIGDTGALALAKALRTGARIQTLRSKSNAFTDVGAQAILNSVVSNAFMTSLSLSDDPLGSGAARSCALLIKQNHALCSIRINGKKFGKNEVELICSALKLNFTITHLRLFDIQLCWDHDLLREIRGILKRNKSLHFSAFLDAFKSRRRTAWRRSKLMVVGEGEVGKTATVRSLLNYKFISSMQSTPGIELTEVQTTDSFLWKEGHQANFAVELANKMAIKKLKQLSSQTYENQVYEVQPLPRRYQRIYRSEQRRLTISSTVTDSSMELDYTSGLSQLQTLDDTLREHQFGLDSLEMNLLVDAKAQESKIAMTIWDYGGQDVFHTLHHLFLTNYGIYLVVFNMISIVDDDIESIKHLEFWLHSINIHAPNAPVLLVGTYAEDIDNVEELTRIQRLLKSLVELSGANIVENEIYSFFPIDNSNGVGVHVLRKFIEGCARNQDYINLPVSISWMQILDSVLTRKADWMKFSDVVIVSRDIDSSIEEEEVQSMLKIFHELGVLIYYDTTESLKQIVTVNPQWLLDSISSVIFHDKYHHDMVSIQAIGLENEFIRFMKEAIVSRDLLEFLWGPHNLNFLLDMMRHLLLLSNWKHCKDEAYLVPSMLPIKGELSTAPVGHSFEFKFKYLPDGLFERVVCLSLEFSFFSKDEYFPILSKRWCRLSFGNRPTIYLYEESNKIRITTENEEAAPCLLRLYVALMNKITKEVMNSRLEWETKIKDSKGKWWNLNAAQLEMVTPWFHNGSTRINLVKLDIESFLETI